jgi:hypothetical protein
MHKVGAEALVFDWPGIRYDKQRMNCDFFLDVVPAIGNNALSSNKSNPKEATQ